MGVSGIFLSLAYYYIAQSCSQDAASPETVLCLVLHKCCSEIKVIDSWRSAEALGIDLVSEFLMK